MTAPGALVTIDRVSAGPGSVLVADERYLREALELGSSASPAHASTVPVLASQLEDNEIIAPVFSAEFVFRASLGKAAVDPLELAPIYPREPEAVTKWRSRPQ